MKRALPSCSSNSSTLGIGYLSSCMPSFLRTGTRGYVQGLDDWIVAQRDSVAKVEGKTQFDKKAKSRSFEVGDQVLVMTPSMMGKLDDQWTGPYAEKMNEITLPTSCGLNGNTLGSSLPCRFFTKSQSYWFIVPG